MKKVSIILPSYASSSTLLRQCIDSLQNQIHDNFELIIVHDPCDPGTDEAVEWAIDEYRDDNRIIYIKNIRRLGLVDSLNLGITKAKSDFIARADVDDTSDPKRLGLQLEYMTTNKCDVLGSWAVLQGPSGEKTVRVQKPVSHEEISRSLMYHNQIMHSTVLLRKQVFSKTGLYDDRFRYSEDYELWLRLNSLGFRLSNIPEYLVTMKQESTSVTRGEKWRENRISFIKCKLYAYQNYGYRSPRDLFWLFVSPLSLFVTPNLYSYYLTITNQ